MDLWFIVGGEVLNVILLLFGVFNFSNVMVVIGVLYGSGVVLGVLVEVLVVIILVLGCMELVCEVGKFIVIVDYVYILDGLEKVLVVVCEYFFGWLYCVVGCGGDWDIGKWFLMVVVVECGVDWVLFISDNLCGEDL